MLRWLIAGAVCVTVCAPRMAEADRAVTGTVLDARTGSPVPGALVAIGAFDTGTDDAGAFRLADVPFGRLDVVVIADGYHPFFGSARVGAELVIRLQPDDSAAGEVIEVSGRAPEAPPVHLSTEEIRTLPGAGNDALRALQSMPGVARTPFGLGGLAMRGTAPRDTKVYLDGIEVPLLYHFGGLASFLPTGAVDELALEPGGASVRYGRGLGGVATITSRTGRRDRWRAGGEVSLIHAAALAEGPGPLGGSWLVGARRSYFDAIEEAAGLDLALAPRYGDAQLRWESGDGRWMAILFASDDKLRLLRDPNDMSSGGIDTSNVKSFSYVSRFARLGARYRAVRRATQFTLMPSIGIDDVNARANHKDIDKGLHRTTVPISLRADVATPLFGGTLSVGFDGGWQRHSYDILNTPPPTPADPSPDMVVHRELDRWAADLGAWVEQSWFFAQDRIEMRPGLRGDHFGLSDQWTLDPRVVIHERLPNGFALSQSLGRYHEPPLITDLDPIFGERKMLGSSATQVALGMKKIIGDDKEASATVYYQDLRQLPVDAITGATPISANGGTSSGGLLGISRELVDTQFGSYSYREAIGTGHAYGLELITRKNLGRWTGWASYTYARSYRKNPIIDDTSRPYVLDQPHSITLLGTGALGRSWRIGGRVRYVTGNPFTPVAGAYVDAKGDWVAIDGELLSVRLPAFFQLDLRVDRIWRRPWGSLNLYLDVQNVFNRANAEGVTYNNDYTHRSYTRGLPIFPSLGLEYIP
ncbi:MAG TPA: carboxypeptidase regulatory-like domain-containing protein [Kofleriaceae bacterium]|nr:carboxypeptidase regulatory-like domain-containing protein [Kofleriaceae bacterium]